MPRRTRNVFVHFVRHRTCRLERRCNGLNAYCFRFADRVLGIIASNYLTTPRVVQIKKQALNNFCGKVAKNKDKRQWKRSIDKGMVSLYFVQNSSAGKPDGL